MDPKSAPLWYMTPNFRSRRWRSVAFRRRDVLPVEEDPARGRPVEADHVLQQRALAAPGTAQDHEHLAAAHVEREIALDDVVAVGDRDVLDGDDHRWRAHIFST